MPLPFEEVKMPFDWISVGWFLALFVPALGCFVAFAEHELRKDRISTWAPLSRND